MFEKTLSDQGIIEKSQTTFEVIVKGDPTPTVEWFKENAKIKSNEEYKIQSSNENHTMLISSTNQMHVGEYKVVATNSAGTAESSAKLDVTNKPHFILELPKQSHAIESQSYRFEVSVTGNPVPDVAFFKDGVEMKSMERFEKKQRKENIS